MRARLGLAIASLLVIVGFSLTAAASAVEVHVGPLPGQTPRIIDVPWETLGAGDSVFIHYRTAAQGGDYHEKITLTRSGAEGDPIRIVGVPGPNGELPTLNGANALSRSGPGNTTLFQGNQNRGLLTFAEQYQGDYFNGQPRYIEVEGLKLTGAKPSNTFQHSLTGAVTPYAVNAAALFVQRGSNIAFRNLELTDSSFGIFGASVHHEDGTQGEMIRNLTLEDSYIHGNGVVGSEGVHNYYMEVSGMTVRDNHFGPLRPGATGSNLKDRGANLLIENNYIEDGARWLDLVEPEDSFGSMNVEPGAQQVTVRGNVFRQTIAANAPNNPFHLGYDNVPAQDRKTKLTMHNNTMILEGSQDVQYHYGLFKADTSQNVIDFYNNIVLRTPANGNLPELYLQRNENDPAGVLDIGANNYITTGELFPVRPGFGGGTVNGYSSLNLVALGNVLGIDLANPGSASYGKLLAGSPLVGIDTGAFPILSPPAPGDLNGDGSVDRADAATIAAHFGNVAATAGDGDLSGDGAVSLADLAILQGHLGPSSANSPFDMTSVPEPDVWALLFAGVPAGVGIAAAARLRTRRAQ